MICLDEMTAKAWAGAVIDDDPAGPDQTAQDAVSALYGHPWPRWAVAVLERLTGTAVWP